jgi:hypothetical protein
MFPERRFEPWVVQKEPNNLAMSGADATREGLYVPPGQWPEPSPATTQRACGATLDFAGSLLTG